MNEQATQPAGHKKSSPKDVFLHLLAIITLYVSAGSFVSLLFQYINIYFPDPLDQGYYTLAGAYQAVRFAVASLIVMFPAYVITTRFLNQSYKTEPEKRNLRVRRWLVYFTLFAAGLIMLGDLVTLIYNFLNGDLTTRFALKILTVLIVAWSVFWYYFRDLRQHQTE